MKNLKNKYLALVFLSCLGLMASCKKYINEAPIDTPTDATFWTSESAAESGLAGAYGLLRTAVTNQSSFFVFGDATANEFNFSATGNWWNLQTIETDGNFNFNYVPYLEGSLQNWTDFYQVIAQCNLIIAKVPGIPASGFTDDEKTTKNNIIGQAYFLRGYCYYYISQVWGQPVIVTKNYTDPINAQPVPRSTTQAGYDQAIADAKTASSLLKFGYSNAANIAVQANKGSALTLLAKAYMWEKKYDLAAVAADSVLLTAKTKGGGYKLEAGATYGNIFKGHNAESIFELNMIYSPNQNEAQDGFGGVFSVFLSAPVVFGKSNDNWYLNTTLISSLYGKSAKGAGPDLRVNATFYGLKTQNPLMIKYSNVIYGQPADETSPFISNNLVIFRLADVYLLRAEAALSLGDQSTAVADVNIIRVRAGLEPLSSVTLYDIMDERGREFFGEGSWYFDLYRTGLLVDPNYDNVVDGYTPARLQQQGCLWPLYLRSLLPQDPLLTQNPYWAVAGQ